MEVYQEIVYMLMGTMMVMVKNYKVYDDMISHMYWRYVKVSVCLEAVPCLRKIFYKNNELCQGYILI